MATVSLIDPYSQQAEEIARRKRMAQALQESGSQVLDMPTTPGVTISPYAGLAKILESGLGAYQEAKAQKDYAALQDKYRTNYNTQLGEMARLISAPEVKGVAGTSEIPYEPAQTEKIYGTKPAPVMGSGYGSGMLMPDQVIGEKVIKPEVPYQAAVAPVQGQPAGYISAADLQKIDIPEIKQLLMAKYLKQFEPEQLTLGENQRLLRRVGGGDFKEVVGVSKTPTAATPSDLARLLAERAAIAAKNPTDPNLATYDSAIEKLTQDKNLAFQREKFEYETANPGYSYEKITNLDGSETIQAINKATGVARPVRTGTGQVLTSAAPKTTPRYSEIEDKGNIVIVDMNLPANERLEKGQIKGPIRGNLKQIATNDAEGRPVTRWVEETTLAKLGDIPQQYTGLLLEMAQAGQLKPGWESDPRVAGVIRDNLINQSGGITPARLADIRVRIAEAAARLGDLGIAFDAKGLTPPLSNLTTLPSGSSVAATPAAAAIAKAPPKINDVVVDGDKKFKFKGGDPNQQSNWVEVK